jgi:hypothetical protein
MNARNQIALATATEVAEWAYCGQPEWVEDPWKDQIEKEEGITRYFRHTLTNEVCAAIEFRNHIQIVALLPPAEEPYPERIQAPDQKEKTTWSIASSLRKDLLSDDTHINNLMLFCICMGLLICTVLAVVSQTDFGDREEMTNYILVSGSYLMIIVTFTGVYLIKSLRESRARRKKERNTRRYEDLAAEILKTGIIPDNIAGEPMSPATRRKIEKILFGKKNPKG